MKTEAYEGQQQYVENLSHELLTPLAIIRTEAELLLQSENIIESDLIHLDKIIETVNRLTKINKGLILLSKLNSGIYVDKETIDLQEIVHQIMGNFQNQIDRKKIHIKITSEEKTLIECNKTLLEILMMNALKNAINHNITNGEISIHYSKRKLTIINTGKVNTKPSKELFNRFTSENNTMNSVGLGLSIMQKISEYFNYALDYQNKGTLHTLTIHF
jgi:signal transduction histidine kinase